MELVQRKAMEFDRKVFRRNLRETLAALLGTTLFTWMAFHALNTLQRTGLLIVAASGIWIIFFLLRYGRASAPADPGQDLAAYRRDMAERYDRQISLLKSVKYWYLLPPWIGMMLNSAGLMMNHVQKGKFIWPDVLALVFLTVAFAFVWWLNEHHGVAKLRAVRDRTLREDATGPEGSA